MEDIKKMQEFKPFKEGKVREVYDIGENLTGNDAASRLLDVGTGGVLDGDFKIGRLEDELSLIGGLEQDAREDGEGRARRHAL